MDNNNLFSYKDFNNFFEIHTDYNRYATRNDYHINFYKNKLTKNLKSYAVTDKQMISIARTFKIDENFIHR